MTYLTNFSQIIPYLSLNLYFVFEYLSDPVINVTDNELLEKYLPLDTFTF